MNEGTVQVGDATIAYRLQGPRRGPVLVLSGSLGTGMTMWDETADTLSSHFRVLCYDHRGNGASSTTPGPYSIEMLGRDLLGLVDDLGLERFALCGLSLGGLVAMWVASVTPDRVTSLVLAATAPRIGDPSGWEERAALVRREGTSAVAEALEARWFGPGFAAGHPEVTERILDAVRNCDDEGYAACCEALGSANLRDAVAKITAPTLVVAGRHDPVTPPATCLALAEAVSGASLSVLGSVAHLANLGSEGSFEELVLSHFIGIPSVRGKQVRRAVLGDGYVDAAAARRSTVNAPFQDLITRAAWGEIWTRPALERRLRSALTIAMLVALGRFEELKLHVPGGLRNGLSEEEVVEILLQAAIYCGFPAANSAFAVTEPLLAAWRDED